MGAITLDLTRDTKVDLLIKKDRTLKPIIPCVYYTGTTNPVEVEFDFSAYTGATLQVKRDAKSSYTILDFDTDDGSIVLSTTGNTFQLIKTDVELSNVQSGEFEYDMYLRSVTVPKREFLYGKFIIEDRITP